MDRSEIQRRLEAFCDAITTETGQQIRPDVVEALMLEDDARVSGVSANTIPAHEATVTALKTRYRVALRARKMAEERAPNLGMCDDIELTPVTVYG